MSASDFSASDQVVRRRHATDVCDARSCVAVPSRPMLAEPAGPMSAACCLPYTEFCNLALVLPSSPKFHQGVALDAVRRALHRPVAFVDLGAGRILVFDEYVWVLLAPGEIVRAHRLPHGAGAEEVVPLE